MYSLSLYVQCILVKTLPEVLLSLQIAPLSITSGIVWLTIMLIMGSDLGTTVSVQQGLHTNMYEVVISI